MRTWDPTVSVTETNQKKQVPLMEGMPLASSSECKAFFLVLYSWLKEIPNYPEHSKLSKTPNQSLHWLRVPFFALKNQSLQETSLVQSYSSFHGLLRNHKSVARNKFNSYILMADEL
ncbi:hypothetical protein NC651_017419 [Populus alba x Populus x berolinensis]|nr:hypothetical protein NC651_017419 [Populus alba x Populus x berolinensis]